MSNFKLQQPNLNDKPYNLLLKYHIDIEMNIPTNILYFSSPRLLNKILVYIYIDSAYSSLSYITHSVTQYCIAINDNFINISAYSYI